MHPSSASRGMLGISAHVLNDPVSRTSGMAEPLLKRTFSKLRPKERFRRKADPKLADVTGKVELFQTSSCSMESEICTAEERTRRSQITVSKKQNWAKLPPAGQTASSAELYSGLVYGPQDWDLSSARPDAPNQAWNQRTQSEDCFKRKWSDLDLEFGYARSASNPPDASLPELTPPSSSHGALCTSSSATKMSGQGAYLQHLDSSSRAWVLSTGKTQTSEETITTRITEWRQGRTGEGNIWYNPIPEEEDCREYERYGNPWRRREIEEMVKENGEMKASGGSTATHQMKDMQSDADVIRADGLDPVQAPDPTNSDSPETAKKSTVEGGINIMERIKSPGTVRRLSMKMRKLPELRRKLSLRSSRNQKALANQGQAAMGGGASDEASPPSARKESSNVISKYHLDSSAPERPRQRSWRHRSASKGGYLSDGDSPELLPKGQSPKGSAMTQIQHSPPQDSLGLADLDSFRLYAITDQPRCAQRLSGLLTVHLLGVEEFLRYPRQDASKEVFCAIQVDGVTRGRTSLLTCRGACLPLNHTFNLELERARMLKLVILTPTASTNVKKPAPVAPARNRVCCMGAVAIPPLFKGSRSQPLCVRLEPRGLLYVKLTLLEHFETPFTPLPAPSLADRPPPAVFGQELHLLVEKEANALAVPLIIQKCVSEIERRGLRVVGLYRLCGSAAVKKELRDAFERNSAAVTLSEELYPDVNVITGILKDYLRELPSPLITRTLYEVVLDAMTVRPTNRSDAEAQRSQDTVSLLQCLPEPERATLSFLLDHLSLVASFSVCNRMTGQNLAVCFGPVLLTPNQDAWQAGLRGAMGTGDSLRGTMASGASSKGGGGRSFTHSEEIASAVDFKRHIEALHYLLQLWPDREMIKTKDSRDQSMTETKDSQDHGTKWTEAKQKPKTAKRTQRTKIAKTRAILRQKTGKIKARQRPGTAETRARQRPKTVEIKARQGQKTVVPAEGVTDELDSQRLHLKLPLEQEVGMVSPQRLHIELPVTQEGGVFSSSCLHLDLPVRDDVGVVSRRGRGRLESPPCNRYAGDWSICGRDFLSNDDADYDEVAGSESDEDEKNVTLYMDDFTLDFDAPFTCRLSLKDFDTLISDLERELAKQINICL
ncbi:hypothetical protein DNTS_009016 [Danionella cerebrum]|uniref:Rho GTPase-activating protein SYDE1 n=1 Tax=Danionella cerebrum TaxID=2873325 RepID=A0A553QAE0_9TELE|nr:hypothetical protein DNTS_009016 [Danionella translucida]TRY86892.1 hypothetical protein DNTS_009016 [Danionella translucida]